MSTEKTKSVEEIYSTLSQEKFNAIKNHYGLRPSDGAALPGPNRHIRDPPPGQVGIYKKIMEAGLRLPVSKFVEDLLSYYHIHLNQLKPNAMFKIVAFELLCKAKKVEPTVPLFRVFYRLSVSEDWFIFNNRDKDKKIAADSKMPTKRWKYEFFWVNERCVPKGMVFGTVSKTWTDPADTIHPQIIPYLSKIKKYCVPGDEFSEYVLAASGKTAVWDLHNKSMIPWLYVWVDGKKKHMNLLRALLQMYPRGCEIQADPVPHDFPQVNDEEEPNDNYVSQGIDKDEYESSRSSSPMDRSPRIGSLSSLETPKRKRGDFAMLLSNTDIRSSVRASPCSGGKRGEMFKSVMHSVGIPMAPFGKSSFPVMVGGGSTFLDGATHNVVGCPQSCTTQTSRPPHGSIEPPSIFCPSWAITHNTDVLDPKYGSDFVSHVFPPPTLSRMDEMSVNELTERRYAHMVQSMAYNLGTDRRHKKDLEEANNRADRALSETVEYKTKYEVAIKNHQEEHDRLVAQISNLQLQVATLNNMENQLSQSKADMGWMLQNGISESFDKAMCSKAFLGNSKKLYQAYSDLGSEQAVKKMKDMYPVLLLIPDDEIPRGSAEALEQAMHAFATEDYVMSSCLDRSSYEAFRASLSREEEDDD